MVEETQRKQSNRANETQRHFERLMQKHRRSSLDEPLVVVRRVLLMEDALPVFLEARLRAEEKRLAEAYR